MDEKFYRLFKIGWKGGDTKQKPQAMHINTTCGKRYREQIKRQTVGEDICFLSCVHIPI